MTLFRARFLNSIDTLVILVVVQNTSSKVVLVAVLDSPLNVGFLDVKKLFVLFHSSRNQVATVTIYNPSFLVNAFGQVDKVLGVEFQKASFVELPVFFFGMSGPSFQRVLLTSVRILTGAVVASC